MAASKEDIRSWLLDAKKSKATHVIIVCDTYDYDDYPVDVLEGQVVQDVMKRYSGVNMQRVMEVYNLSLDIETQLLEHRAMNL